MQAADGEVAAVPEENAEKLLQDLEEACSETSRPPSVMASDVDTHSMASSGFVDAHIRRGKASSVISVESDATIGKDVGGQSQGPSSLPPLPPPKDPPQRNGQKEASEATSSSAMPSTSSSFANTLASGLNVAMRFVMNSSEPSWVSTPSSPKKHHGLLFAEGATIDCVLRQAV
jgi:1-phosphatidylinositol-3-phosphate 5-kinase